ncbi:SPATA22 [Mytilus edulis]|uniref:SPATA22 n=1 Tax=Mytilus edulis TaxID=6550 RepID=A0A8S3SIS6_MYTED|nr:SPATA22 [Mytilus edulis]
MGDSSRPMKQQTKGNNSVPQQQSVPYLKGGYASQSKTSYVDQSKVNQPRRFPSATITSANQRVCSTNSGLQYGQEQGNKRNQQQPTQTPMVKTYQGLQNNQQNYRNYKQNTQQSYGSAQNTQQSYGSAQNTQQSYGSAQNTQQSYGSAQQQGYQQSSKSNQQNKPFNKVAMPMAQGVPFTGGIPIDKSPARVLFIRESQRFLKQQNKKPSEKKIDPSLHVMTLHLSSVPHWAKYRDNINMIFEVFGIIDSAVIRDATGTHREFILRDEQHHLKCVFYEIDRELQKLIRGHWHRCVGTYDIKNGCFKCVSVRAATMEEKNHGQQLAKSTNELLKQMTRHLPEQ